MFALPCQIRMENHMIRRYPRITAHDIGCGLRCRTDRGVTPDLSRYPLFRISIYMRLLDSDRPIIGVIAELVVPGLASCITFRSQMIGFAVAPNQVMNTDFAIWISKSVQVTLRTGTIS